MNAESKSKLVRHLQEWLDEESVANDLGGDCGMWQDGTGKNRNAHLMADAVELVVRSAELQLVLDEELNS